MDKKIEIESLNVDDLDVEELERRIEMASASPEGTGIFDAIYCDVNCGTFSAA